MDKEKTTVRFFASYRDAAGIQHYEVQSFNNVTRSVDMMKDHLFDRK